MNSKSRRHQDQATCFPLCPNPRASRSNPLNPNCQPGPAARSFAITSGSSLTLICSFATADFGHPRPRRMNVSPWNSSAASSISRVGSGASSGSVHSGEPAAFFVGMGKPHGNDATGAVARCPDNDHTSPAKISGGDEAVLAIIPPDVRRRDSTPREHKSGIGEIEPPMAEGVSSLVRVEANIRLSIASRKRPASINVMQKIYANIPAEWTTDVGIPQIFP
jgi:hypothetical protein